MKHVSARRVAALRASLAVLVAVTGLTAGCNTSTGPGDSNSLLTEALSYDGSISGKALDSQSTRGSTGVDAAGQSVPPDFDTENTVVRFHDMDGQPLVSPNGEPIPAVPMNADGTFDADGLPVGTDFTVCVDIGGDGDCDIETWVNIPAESQDSTDGTLDGVQVDPLTTTVLGKLRDMMESRGIHPEDLPFSPTTIVARIVAAYTNLFDEAGLDLAVVLEDIAAMTPEELAEFFDTVIPPGAQAGMQMAEGNLDASLASSVEEVAMGAAKVFLRAGFPVIDDPGGIDLSALAEMDGVEVRSMDELFGPPIMDDPMMDGPPMEPAPASLNVYINKFAEPDRNFASADGFDSSDGGLPPLPFMSDHLLIEMARLQMSGGTISVGDLHDLLTDLQTGLGARLTYFLFDPNFFGPPLTVFETADGRGFAISLDEIFVSFMEKGFDQVDFETFEQMEADIRAELAVQLASTIPPAFDRIFNVLVAERLGSAEQLATSFRSARAHLPFSRSGPSAFFVVADGDAFRPDAGIVSALTVDAEVTPEGLITSVTHNADGAGKYFLGFTEATDGEGIVELIVRENGRFLHSHQGPVRVSIFDDAVFAAVNGQPFSAFVSESGNFYPGINVVVVKTDYVPAPPPPEEFYGEPVDQLTGDPTADPIQDPTLDSTVDPILDPILEPIGDPTTDPAPEPVEFVEDSGPNDQIFVLAEGLGEFAQPVRIDYDYATGAVTYNPGGRNFLMFLPDSHETGLFALFNEDTGRPASANDPMDFFVGPIDQPDTYGDFYNQVDGFDDLTAIDDIGTFVDDTFSADGSIHLPDGTVILADGTLILPDGTQILPDGTQILPDGTVIPSDGTQTLPDGTLVFEDGSQVLPDGTLILADGTQILPDGTWLYPDGSQTLPDGTLILADGTQILPDGTQILPDGTVILPVDSTTAPIAPAEFVGTVDTNGFILVAADSLVGLPMAREAFTHVFGTDVPNLQYNSDGDPYFDDVNGNGVQDADEATAAFRPLLFDPGDWRATDIRLYYRRADNGAAVSFDNVAFDSPTPMTMDGVELVPRAYLPRLNAFRFGRPNTALNLITAFAPPELFNGTNAFNEDTRVDIFGALALLNLVMDQVFNVEANVDMDGLGPLPAQSMLIDAHMFIAPIGDPFLLILDGFADRLSGGTAGAPVSR